MISKERVQKVIQLEKTDKVPVATYAAKLISSKSLIEDSKQELACSFLSVILVMGLGLNYVFWLWQADPIVGLFVVPIVTLNTWTFRAAKAFSP